MTSTRTRWDVTNQLRTEEDARLYIEEAFEKDLGDEFLICAALSDIARGRNLNEFTQEIVMIQKVLPEALSENGSPSFGTVLKIIRALGMWLQISS